MIRVDIHETIDRPVEQVFDRLADIDGYSEWRSGAGGIFMSCHQDSPGPVAEGSRYTDRTLLGSANGEVAELQRPTHIVFHYRSNLFGRRVIEGWPGYTLTPDGEGGTLIHHHAHAQTYGPFRVLEPLLQWVANVERRRTVDALKASFH